MFRKTLAALALALLHGMAQATPTLSLQGPSELEGTAGSTVGWGFSIAADAGEWISFIGSVLIFESQPALGVYTDFVGAQGGPFSFVLPPGDGQTWAQSFDALLGQGLGSYTLDAGAAPGDRNEGVVRALYERFSGDPNHCGNCWLGSGELDVPVAVRVVSAAVPVPSPASLPLATLAIGLLAVQRRRSLRGRRAALPRQVEEPAAMTSR